MFLKPTRDIFILFSRVGDKFSSKIQAEVFMCLLFLPWRPRSLQMGKGINILKVKLFVELWNKEIGSTHGRRPAGIVVIVAQITCTNVL